MRSRDKTKGLASHSQLRVALSPDPENDKVEDEGGRLTLEVWASIAKE